MVFMVALVAIIVLATLLGVTLLVAVALGMLLAVRKRSGTTSDTTTIHDHKPDTKVLLDLDDVRALSKANADTLDRGSGSDQGLSSYVVHPPPSAPGAGAAGLV